MGLSRTEELTLAIESCKEMILQSEVKWPPWSSGYAVGTILLTLQGKKNKRRKLVEKLVQLRFQLQEMKVRFFL